MCATIRDSKFSEFDSQASHLLWRPRSSVFMRREAETGES